MICWSPEMPWMPALSPHAETTSLRPECCPGRSPVRPSTPQDRAMAIIGKDDAAVAVAAEAVDDDLARRHICHAGAAQTEITRLGDGETEVAATAAASAPFARAAIPAVAAPAPVVH